MDEYYARLTESMAKSNHEYDVTILKTEEGYLRHYMHIVINGVVHGLVCLNYD